MLKSKPKTAPPKKSAKKDADDEVVLTIPKSESEEIRVTLREYKGRASVDLRTFWLPDNADEHIPTKKGVSISDAASLRKLYKALKTAVSHLEGGE